jgi:hypothetical protein
MKTPLLCVLLCSAPLLADTTIKDLSELKATPLPYPAAPATAAEVPAIEQLQAQAESLATALGTFPPQLKKSEDRQTVYEVWAQVMASANALAAERGEPEPVVCLLALLYREGHNLDVQECAQRNLALLGPGLTKFPDSVPLNFEAAHFYLGIGRGAMAERALLHLRGLLRTCDDMRVERPLLFAYFYQDKRAEMAKQVEHCLALCPDDRFFLQMKESLVKGGMRQIRVPVGSPNEVTLKGDPTIHLALDRLYRTMEIKPQEGTPNKDLRAYLFIPEDDQSSAVLFIGNDGCPKTEETIAQMHEGAKVTKAKGTFNGAEIELWHYRDSQHLYSTFSVIATDSAGTAKRVEIDLVANTPERLEVLETAFSLIDFL